MKPTYQQQLIADFLHARYVHHEKWPFLTSDEVVRHLCSINLALFRGEYLAAVVDGTETIIRKVASLEELSVISNNAHVFSYAELEGVFYEQHAEWVEV
jgi:hypothetical protein